MVALRNFRLLCFILVVTIVELKAEELKNVTNHSQGNATLASLSHQGEKHELKGKHNVFKNEVLFNTSKDSWYYRGGGGGGGGGGGFRWGGGGGGGGGGGAGGGGSGWGWGGGGGGWWKWGCRREARHGKGKQRVRHYHTSTNEDYRMGEFAQCMARTRCRGLRLDCPLHCGGPCFYDCHHMCKAHCRRP
ncbi:hypothetical protein GLYMA_14G216600v4 [Glycine max]|uniref:Uncharacterized protein n=1 Tax=Glycine max TaxID=3847 RepID=K7M8M4_SOYBN|nr:YEATS domain-containing protein 2 [Glycine max]KAH1095666.1 hypothetical protein GYH30_040790 [Glycine max]KRH17385.1 hypothetical protein GLYMA_14G216600v4 [Glycine max]|eukprot:XP_014622356.1 YEATS domain-containing protein 2 [Glycine max]